MAPVRHTLTLLSLPVEDHFLWNSATLFLDPLGHDNQYIVGVPRPVQQQREAGGTHGPALLQRIVPQRRTYTNYVRTLTTCCLPCRFHNPNANTGLNANGATVWSRHFGEIPLCQRHHPDRICGICLKDEVVDTWKMSPDGVYTAREQTIFPVEEDHYLKDVRATCRSCRNAVLQHVLRPRVPKDLWQVIDPIIDPFLEFSDGCIKDIIVEVDEKLWLIAHTNYQELHDSAMAAERARLREQIRAEREAENSAPGRRAAQNEARLQQLLESGDASPEAIEQALAMQAAANEEDEEDLLDEDFGELLNQAEESNVTDIALNQWARARILSGCWISPLDIYQGVAGTRIRDSVLQRALPPWHPVKSYHGYPNDPQALNPDGTPIPMPHHMPSNGSIHCPYPPGRLFQRAQWHFENNLRRILYPALENLVSRLIHEAEMEAKDVCRLAAAFSSGMILEELVAVQLWGDKYDWSNASTSPTMTSTATIESGSDRDSPPSTIRTTPSPSPPATTSPKSSAGVFATAQRAVRLPSPPSPTAWAFPSRLLATIPFIPRANEHIGPNALVLLDIVWKEAVGGLFACQCTICLRASGIIKAKEEARRRAKEEEAAKLKVNGQEPVRQTAPPPSPNLPSTDNEMEEDGELKPVRRASSPPQSSTPLRRSRTVTEDGDLGDNREPKRPKITPPPPSLEAAGHRRSREEDMKRDDRASDRMEEDVRETKKMRVTP